MSPRCLSTSFSSWRWVASKARRTTVGNRSWRSPSPALRIVTNLCSGGTVNVHSHPKRIPALLVRLRFLDRNLAAHHVRTNALEFSRLLTNERFNGCVLLNIAESHLQRDLHNIDLQRSATTALSANYVPRLIFR